MINSTTTFYQNTIGILYHWT